jgi:dTDP-4-amino-4,6-dideoxygalactose transaminase
MSPQPTKGSALDIASEPLAGCQHLWPRPARLAPLHGAEHAIAVNSCTAARHLSLLAGAVGQGHEAITTPLTFCATANVVVHTGATPVFADIDPDRALHLQPFYQERFGLRRGMFPAAEAVSDSTLSLPLSVAMAPEAVERVIEALHDVLG